LKYWSPLMQNWMMAATLLALAAAAGCSRSPSQPAARLETAAAAPSAEQPSRSDALARADALVEDLRRREAAQTKFDRENPAPAVVASPTPPPVVASPSRPTVTAPIAAQAPTPPAPSPSIAAATARDEKWWKDQMRSLQATLDEATEKLAEVEKANFKYGYNDAQAEYKKRLDAVTTARQAVDRLHDEARRAGVPPAWLRLP
jgi:transcription initiation factor TFIID subunit TAF12